MDIDDVLELPEFKHLNDRLNGEMRENITDQILHNMVRVFSDERSARKWFYSKVPLFDFKRPYDLCRSGRTEEVEALLGKIRKNYPTISLKDMEVEDFLKHLDFKGVSEYLHTEMYRNTTHVITQRIGWAFRVETDARRWFFSRLPVLDFQRPYDLCKDGETIEIEDLLERMLQNYTQ